MKGLRADRRGKRLLKGGHPFQVTGLVVYPTARPFDRRVLEPQREIQEIEAADLVRPLEGAVALFEFLRRMGSRPAPASLGVPVERESITRSSDTQRTALARTPARFSLKEGP